MWAISRRASLFAISYTPLAVIYLVLRWPAGWSALDLVSIAAFAAAPVALIILPPAVTLLASKRAKLVVGALLAGYGVAVAILAVKHHWLRPLSADPPAGHTSALVFALATSFVLLGVACLTLLLYNARRAGETSVTVSDPRDQGSAVAGYLATYLLPLLGVAGEGWRVSAAYAIYFVVLFVVYVQSDRLVLVNPTLYVVGYRVYDVQLGSDTNHRRIMLVTKRRLTGSADVQLLPLGDDHHITKEPK